MILAIWLACGTAYDVPPVAVHYTPREERGFDDVHEVWFPRVKRDPGYRWDVVSAANDPSEPDWRLAIAIVALADADGLPNEDTFPAMVRRWEETTAAGYPDVVAWRNIMDVCQRKFGCDAEGDDCTRTPPPACRLPDPKWLGCPAKRDKPMLCFPMAASDAWQRWIPQAPEMAPATTASEEK
jgi:hypothetical protein